MAGTFHNCKLADGVTLDVDGYSYTSSWVDVSSFPFFSVTVVLTGGAPTGLIKLQQSNDLQWTGTGSPIRPLHVGNPQFVSDAVDVPSGMGQNTASVSGAGSYALNQYRAPYRWVRVVYTPLINADTTLDIFFTAKASS